MFNSKTNRTLGLYMVLIILFALAVIIFLPWVVLWALNNVFYTGVDLTLKTWLATWVLIAFVSALLQANKPKIVINRPF